MFGLDEWIAAFGSGHPLLLASALAVLLGLRHATDPDHLSAVSTLVAAERDRRAHRAACMGLAWGAGHATTLFAFGIPIVLFASYIPSWVQSSAEAAVGVLIIALAVRLLVRWRRGRLHSHVHEHDGVSHRHLHGHDARSTDAHAALPVRSSLAAYGIGLLHGLGGSAGVGLLLLASITDPALAVGALLVFALFTAAAMAACSGAVGLALSARPVIRAFDRVAPALGVASIAFGAWYVAGAFALIPYPL